MASETAPEVRSAPQRPEQQKSSEREPFSTQGFEAASARILLGGDALNPAKTDLAEVTQETIPSREHRDYSAANAVSTRSRERTWKSRPEKTYAEKRKSWLSETEKHFQKEQNQIFFA